MSYTLLQIALCNKS